MVYMCVNSTEPPFLPSEAMSGFVHTRSFKSKYRAIAVYELPELPQQ